MKRMTDAERYIFDLKGYLVVRGVLSPEEVREVNEAIDTALPDWASAAGAKYIHTGLDEETMRIGNTDPTKGPVDFYGGLLLDWGEPLRRLVGHPKLLPYLSELMGPAFRLDHQYAIFMKPDHEFSGVHVLHGGNTPYDASQYYHFRDGRFFSGLTVATFFLTDVPAGSGGFCCIPGSHKSNLPLPRHFADVGEPVDCVTEVPARAGDVLLFTEALTHGCLMWKARHERRALLFKYCPGHMQWEKGSPFTSLEYEWDDLQRSVLRGAYFGGRPALPTSSAEEGGDAGGER